MSSVAVCWKPGVCAAFAACAVLACASDAEDSNAPGSQTPSSASTSGEVSESEFLSQFGALACAGLEVCCAEAGFGYNAALCQALIAPAPSESASFDPAAARACLDALADTEVACAGGAEVAPCDRVYVGALALGEACVSDDECAPAETGTASCDISRSVCTVSVRGSEGDDCVSSCQALGATGWSCSGGASDALVEVQCWQEDGLVCNGTCQALGAPGAACFSDGECRDDAFCDAAGTCASRTASGAACTGTPECGPSAYCDGTCLPRLPAGQSCSEDDQCLGGLCDGAVCGPEDPFAGLEQALLGLLCGG